MTDNLTAYLQFAGIALMIILLLIILLIVHQQSGKVIAVEKRIKLLETAHKSDTKED